MKREGASTLFIHGYPWDLSYLFRSLALLFQLFEMVLCVWFLKMLLKRGHRCGNLCNDSCLDVYKDVFVFWKVFNVWKLDFEIVSWSVSWSLYEHVLVMGKSEFLPTSSIQFSLTTRVFEEFLDNLESLEHVLQSIFIMKLETTSGTMWKMAKKMGQNPA